MNCFLPAIEKSIQRARDIGCRMVSVLYLGAVAVGSLGADLTPEYVWRPIKIGGGGWVTGLVVHPSTKDLVYARTDVGGVYRWDPDLSTWRQLIVAESLPKSFFEQTTGNPGAKFGSLYQVESIGIAPSAPSVIFVAAGTGTEGPGKLLRSKNFGATFELMNLAVPMAGNAEYRTAERLAVHPTEDAVMLYGARTKGIWRSSDGGMNWTQVPTSQVPIAEPIEKHQVGVVKILFDCTNVGRAYASVAGRGIYRSEDAGLTWKPILEDGLWAEDMDVAGGVLYAVGKKEFGLRRYEPVKGWINITPNQNRNLSDVAVDPSNPRVVYTVSSGFQQFFRSTDSGMTWNNLGTNTLHEKSRANFKSPFAWKMTSSLRNWLSIGELVIDPHHPGRVWLGEGMGVWRCDNLLTSNDMPEFHDVSDGIEEMVANDIVAMPGGRVITAVWDRVGFLHRSLDQGPEAQLGLTNEFNSGWCLATSPANPDFVAAVVTNHIVHNKTFSGTSSDGGVTWQRFGSVNKNGINRPEGLRFGELVVSATDPQNLVWLPRSSEKSIQFSTDGGSTWEASNFQPDDWSSFFFGNRRRLTADGALPGVFYLYQWKKGNVFVSQDKGATFTHTGGKLSSFTHRSQLKGVPGHAGHLWFVHGWDHAAKPDALSRSTDGGVTWTAFPFFDQAWALGFGKAKTQGAYPTIFVFGRAAADSAWGVWRSTDEGGSWDRVAGYPLGIFDSVMVVAGDPEVFGRVYIGWSGNSFAYGQPQASDKPLRVNYR